MKITIDTKEDSHEDIRKVVALLSNISSGNVSRVGSSNIFDDPSPSVGSAPENATPTNAFANMFGGEETKTEEEQPSEEKEEELPEIKPY